jgi:glycosyltransferase involved in cell wall biosynthesis
VRVGVLTTSYPRDADDAAGGFVAGFARWLAANVGDVDVVCADAGRPLFYRGGAPEALARGGRWAEAAAFSAHLLMEAKRRARGWDAVVSHWLVPSAAVGDACGSGRHLAIAHGSDVRLLSSLPGGRALVRRLARRADLVYVAEALRVDGAPGRVVPMAIDVAPVAAATTAAARTAARARFDLDGFVVAFLGRLIHDKGVDLLIDALPDGATLLVGGDGPERASLVRRAAARSDARVRFCGHLAGDDKLALLAAADALAIPSRVDGAPTVALEALAAGLPIIATRAGGLPEVLHQEVAIFCEPRADSIASALARLRDDDRLRATMSRACRARAPLHDWSVVAPRLWNRSVSRVPGCLRTIRV